jgi:uncharacterized protein
MTDMTIDTRVAPDSIGQSCDRKRSLIIYQIKEGVDCPDGIAAAWCAHRYLKNIIGGVDVLGCSYQQEPPDVSNYLCIYIVDFSFPRETIELWLEMGKQITVLDHHKTAQEMIGDVCTFSRHFEFNFDLEQSGATIAWKYFNHDREPPAFLQYVRDRDLWNHALPMTEEIHEASANMRFEIRKTADLTGIPARDLIFSAFDHLATLSQEQLIGLMGDRGFELLKPKREAIDRACERMEYAYLPHEFDRDQISSEMIPIVRLLPDGSENRLISDICAKLYKNIPEALFVACVGTEGWSLRSDKDGSNFDVSEVAKAFGGGGHRNAAGFKLEVKNG